MKRTILIAMGIMLIFSQAGAVETLDLDDYLSLVVDYSRDLKLADRDRALADARKDEAMAGALPKVFIEAGYARNFTDSYMFVDPGAFNGGNGGEDTTASGGEELKFKVSRDAPGGHSGATMIRCVGKARNRDSAEKADNRENHDQLDQGESAEEILSSCRC